MFILGMELLVEGKGVEEVDVWRRRTRNKEIKEKNGERENKRERNSRTEPSYQTIIIEKKK